MADQRYAFQGYKKESMARVLARSLSISTKECVLICNALRRRTAKRAKTILENVLAFKEAIPYTKFNKDTPHRTGIGPGRYPIKACGEILAALKSAIANAQFKGL